MRAISNHDGFTVISNHKSPGAVVISRSGKRFDEASFKRTRYDPGPGSYHPSEGIDKKGNYFYKIKNSGAPVFSKQRR
jgi:hypothetical protein